MSSIENFQKLFDKQIWSRHSKRWYDFLNLIHTVSFKLLSDYKKKLFCVWTPHRLHWKNTVVSNFNFDWLEWDLHRREANTCMKFIQGTYDSLNYRENVKRSIDLKPLRYSLSLHTLDVCGCYHVILLFFTRLICIRIQTTAHTSSISRVRGFFFTFSKVTCNLNLRSVKIYTIYRKNINFHFISFFSSSFC